MTPFCFTLLLSCVNSASVPFPSIYFLSWPPRSSGSQSFSALAHAFSDPSNISRHRASERAIAAQRVATLLLFPTSTSNASVFLLLLFVDRSSDVDGRGTNGPLRRPPPPSLPPSLPSSLSLFSSLLSPSRKSSPPPPHGHSKPDSVANSTVSLNLSPERPSHAAPVSLPLFPSPSIRLQSSCFFQPASSDPSFLPSFVPFPSSFVPSSSSPSPAPASRPLAVRGRRSSPSALPRSLPRSLLPFSSS